MFNRAQNDFYTDCPEARPSYVGIVPYHDIIASLQSPMMHALQDRVGDNPDEAVLLGVTKIYAMIEAARQTGRINRFDVDNLEKLADVTLRSAVSYRQTRHGETKDSMARAFDESLAHHASAQVLILTRRRPVESGGLVDSDERQIDEHVDRAFRTARGYRLRSFEYRAELASLEKRLVATPDVAMDLWTREHVMTRLADPQMPQRRRFKFERLARQYGLTTSL